MPNDSSQASATLPSLSIIIPIYQVEEYIEECLGSIIHQGVACEIILVDDCGTDQSMEIAQRFLADSPAGVTWQSLRHERNRGLSAARNTGMEVAKGDYILFVDSDDKLIDGALPALLTAAQDSQADVIIGSIETNARHLAWNFKKVQSASGTEAREIFLRRHLPQMAWGKLLSRSFLESHQMQFLEGLIHEDELWSMELFLNQPRTLIIPSLVYWYRQDRVGSIMNQAQIEAVLKRDFHKMRILREFIILGMKHNLMDDKIFLNRVLEWNAFLVRDNLRTCAFSQYQMFRYFYTYVRLVHPALLRYCRKQHIDDYQGLEKVRIQFSKKASALASIRPRFVAALCLAYALKKSKCKA